MAAERDAAKRATFRQQQLAFPLTNCVVLDESGTHIAMTPLYGWARKGQRLDEAVPRNRGRVVTVIAALTPQGMPTTLAQTFDGGTTKARFEADSEHTLVPHLTDGQIVVMDNLAAHKTARVPELITGANCQIVFLPFHSPDYSPIELAFGKLKRAVRRLAVRERAKLDGAMRTAMATLPHTMQWPGFGTAAIPNPCSTPAHRYQ